MNKDSSVVETLPVVDSASISPAKIKSQRPIKNKRNLKSMIHIAKKAIAFGKPFHKYLYFSLAMIFISTFFELLVPVFIGKCIDQLIGKQAVLFEPLMKNAIMVLICVMIAAITTYIGNVCTNKYCYKAEGYVREKIFEKFNRVPLKFVDQNSHGDLLSRMINDVSVMTDGILEGITGITNGVITIVGTLIFMLVLNGSLAIVVIIITPISLIIGLYIAKKSYKLFAMEVHSEGELNGYLEEMLSSSKVVRAFNYQDDTEKKYEKINTKYYNAGEKAEFYSNLSNPITRLINATVYGLVALVGSLLAIKGLVSIGLISSFLSYANSFGRPFNELSSEITGLQSAFASADRVFAILDEDNESSEENCEVLPHAEGAISVRDACFGYSPKQRLIENFNLEVAPGQRVAIVGPTGCGKTTFINLLMRFYELTSGEIRVDDHCSANVTRNSLRSNYGMVLQESWLYAATIRDNIAYGLPDATIQEVMEAAKMAGCHEFISKMEKGYDTYITEDGANVSQGQKQLLCIARIMLVKPPMLILDEATSNIDTRTELHIQAAFNHIMKDHTTFIVAHRLSTITSADIILVMNKGNIIEQGTHTELLEKKGFYYYLYNSQFAHEV